MKEAKKMKTAATKQELFDIHYLTLINSQTHELMALWDKAHSNNDLILCEVILDFIKARRG